MLHVNPTAHLFKLDICLLILYVVNLLVLLTILGPDQAIHIVLSGLGDVIKIRGDLGDLGAGESLLGLEGG